MTSFTKQDNLQNNSAVQAQPGIAALVGAVQQRRAQGLYRQPPGSTSVSSASPSTVSAVAQTQAPVSPPGMPPIQSSAPAPTSTPASVPTSAPVSAPAPAPAPASTPTPAVDHTRYGNLPPELQQKGHFCLWRCESRPNTPKPAKVPYDPRTGARASVADPSTFASFGETLQRLTPQYNGIGVLVANDLGAIDLDDAIDANGNPTPEAADIIRRMGCCYTEISPSGRGYRLLFTVRPEFHFDSALYRINNRERHIEVYLPGATNKYVTVTGNVVQQCDLLDRTTQLQGVLDTYMRRAPTPQPAPAISAGSPQDRQQVLRPEDRTLIEGILNSASRELFEKLYAGDLSDYGGDWSRADLALCNLLAARTRDAAQIDCVVRNSGLFRSKWDEPRSGSTYGQMTIAKALASAPERPQQAAPSVPQQATQVPQQAAPSVPQHSQWGSPIPAQELMRMRLPPTKYYVEGLIPEGLTILAASPKAGKTLLICDLLTSTCGGTEFLGLATNPAGCLLLALEDSESRLQQRLTKILDGRPVPDELYFTTTAPRMGNGLYEMLDDYLQQHPAIRVVVIDTLQMVRGVDGDPDSYSYSHDYQDIGNLKKYADSRQLALILVHHTRKASDPDVFSQISGTQGLTGASDTNIVLTRQPGTNEAILSIRGRDVPEREISIQLDKESLRWMSLGDAEDRRRQREREDFFNDPLVKTISSLISATGAWEGTSSDVAAAGKKMGHDLGSPQQVGLKLNSIADKIRIYTDIRYSPKPNGTGGRIHSFSTTPSNATPQQQ